MLVFAFDYFCPRFFMVLRSGREQRHAADLLAARSLTLSLMWVGRAHMHAVRVCALESRATGRCLRALLATARTAVAAQKGRFRVRDFGRVAIFLYQTRRCGLCGVTRERQRAACERAQIVGHAACRSAKIVKMQ